MAQMTASDPYIRSRTGVERQSTTVILAVDRPAAVSLGQILHVIDSFCRAHFQQTADLWEDRLRGQGGSPKVLISTTNQPFLKRKPLFLAKEKHLFLVLKYEVLVQELDRTTVKSNTTYQLPIPYL
jgi:hypothetical protein